MPWIVPSHQAPVLPLKRWRPEWFSGLGLVLGTLAPDLLFIVRLDETGSPAGHTLLGQVYITVPMVLALHALATFLVLPWLVPNLPDGGPFHFPALARSRPMREAQDVARVAVSGLVGSLTHLFLDGFTHGADSGGWAVALLPVLGSTVPLPLAPMPLCELLQIVLTIVLGFLGLRSWGRLARERPSAGRAPLPRLPRASVQSRRAVTRGLLWTAVAGALFGPLLKAALGTPPELKLAGYGAVTGLLLAALAGALVDRARRAVDRVCLETGLRFDPGA